MFGMNRVRVEKEHVNQLKDAAERQMQKLEAEKLALQASMKKLRESFDESLMSIFDKKKDDDK